MTLFKKITKEFRSLSERIVLKKKLLLLGCGVIGYYFRNPGLTAETGIFS